ncbi:MAG: Dabb family protein [Clostridia bacterium]|nr:Dabb family protein [Clostridia bacterium]
MVKHIILWNLSEELTDEQKREVKMNAKAGLESLKGKISGLISIKVNINGLETSNCDMMLDSSFESFEALKEYSVNPEHVKIADTYVRPFTAKRTCIDFEE